MKSILAILIFIVACLATAALADEIPPDARCIAPRDFDTSDLDAVDRFNRICDIEQEVVRLTNANRAKHGLPSLEIDRRLSYVVRYQATLPYRVHGYFYEGFHSQWYKEWFPDGPEIAIVSENAWPLAFQGNDAKDIAFNLADSTAPASDGNPKGWNHHPGHAQNTLLKNATQIAVGVDIRPDGRVIAYTSFSRLK